MHGDASSGSSAGGHGQVNSTRETAPVSADTSEARSITARERATARSSGDWQALRWQTLRETQPHLEGMALAQQPAVQARIALCSAERRPPRRDLQVAISSGGQAGNSAKISARGRKGPCKGYSGTRKGEGRGTRLKTPIPEGTAGVKGCCSNWGAGTAH